MDKKQYAHNWYRQRHPAPTSKVPDGFKEIPGFEGRYYVNRKGEVFSKFRYGRILKVFMSPDGYRTYFLTKVRFSDKTATCRAARLVALTYIPNPESKRTVNHINGIKDDDRVENLEWATHSENSSHSWRMGLQVVTPKMRENMRRIGREIGVNNFNFNKHR